MTHIYTLTHSTRTHTRNINTNEAERHNLRFNYRFVINWRIFLFRDCSHFDITGFTLRALSYTSTLASRKHADSTRCNLRF